METWRAISGIVARAIIVSTWVVTPWISRRTVAVPPVAVVWSTVIVSVVVAIAAIIITIIIAIPSVIPAVVAIAPVAVIGVIGAAAVGAIELSQHLFAVIVQVYAALVVAAVPVAAVSLVDPELRAVKRAGTTNDIRGGTLDTHESEQQNNGELLHNPLSEVARL